MSAAGVQPDPKKISAVKEFPAPRNVKQVRSYLGLCNYYRKFVRNFAKIAEPLNKLTRTNTPFVWDESYQIAFDTLKTALTEAPILAYPDFTPRFDLYVDASDEGIGMVLGQRQEGKERVIAYAGRSLNPAERNYSVTEREGLAVVEGIRHFQSYLYGRQFTIYTDHNALKWLMTLKEPTGRLARWSVLLQQYDFEIKHRAGTTNGNAESLSRRPYPLVAAYDQPGVETARIYDLQRRDPALADIIDYLEHDILPTHNQSAKALVHTIDDYYLDQDGLLCHIWTPVKGRLTTPRSQLVVRTALRHEILPSVHDSPLGGGHLGVHKTYEKVRERYYWRGLFADVQHWCTSCVHCAMKKSPKNRPKAPLLPIPVEGPFDLIGVDVVGPFPVTKSGNRYLIVFTDYLAKWPECFAVPTIDAPVVADLFVNEIIGRHGAPRKLLSDRGTNFLSKLIRELCLLVNTEKVNTTAFHPQCDGLTELFNQTLVHTLSQYVSASQDDWDRHIPAAHFAYRTSPNEITGESPFMLLYGCNPRLPCDISLVKAGDVSASIRDHRSRVVQHIEEVQRLAKTNIQRAQQRMKDYYDRCYSHVV